MDEILKAKEMRVELIQALLKNNKVVICLRCNYPGANKNNPYTNKVINIMHETLNKQYLFDQMEFICDAEGPIYLYQLRNLTGIDVKRRMVHIETNHPLGRLVDIDVYQHTIKSLSRDELKLSKRKCFLCSDNAFNCIVTRRHLKEDLISYFHEIVDEYEHFPLNMIEYTNQAMLYELMTYPSFGLVSPYSTGAHKDMDVYTFIDSASVLNKYMYQFAKLGFQGKALDLLFDEAIEIGKSCEAEMFIKTKGVNTHKGLIFVLGTLVVCSAKVFYENGPFEKIFEYCKDFSKRKLDELTDLSKEKLSHGEAIYLRFKIEGVRKEASLGFPIIQKALKWFDLNDKDTYVKTLIYIMSQCTDTTIIHRKGLEGLEDVHNTMNQLLSNGYSQDDLLNLESWFKNEGISPGGSADLLCGTIFLSLIKNKMNKRREKHE